MKQFYIWAILCPILTALVFENKTYAQCAGNQPAKFISYDTTITGSGNDIFNLSFPKFDDLTLGTLINVTMQTSITLKYGLKLENNNVSSANQAVQIIRIDEITYATEELQKIYKKILGPYDLKGSDGVPGSGLDYIEDGPLSVFTNTSNTYNISTDVTPFLGQDRILIDYNTTSNANAVGNLNQSLTGSAQDTINFKITYFYCPTAFLAVDILQFTAMKLSTGDIQLTWITPNDYAGKKYEIEKSVDGRTFTSLQYLVTGSVPSTGKQVVYHPANDDKKIFFRVRQLEPDGSSKYSSVRQVTLDSDESMMKVYPTLATNAVNVYLPHTVKGDYKVSIISTTGQLMQQSEFSKTNLLRVPFTRKFPAGLYLVAVYNKQTMKSQQSKIIVQ